MKNTLYVLLGFALMLNVSQAQSKKKSGKLDRKTFTCQVLPDAKKPKPIPDELKFSGGTFSCKTMTDDGFKATEYDVTFDSTTSPPTCTFTCDAKNDKEDVYSWTGKITGDDIDGTATLVTKKGKTKKSFSFTGTLKGKKPKKE